jgi:hypothetical protein
MLSLRVFILGMKKFLACCLIIVLIPFFLMVRSGGVANSDKAGIPGNPESIPFTLVIGSSTVPFILPNEPGGNPFQSGFQRIKLPVIEWKFSIDAHGSPDPPANQPFYLFIKVIRAQPLFIITRILRL